VKEILVLSLETVLGHNVQASDFKSYMYFFVINAWDVA